MKLNKLFSTCVALAAVAVMPLHASSQSDIVTKEQPSIKLVVKPNLTISREIPQVNIVPGESESQKKEREAKEAKKASTSRTVVTRESRTVASNESTDLASLRALYQQAAAKFGIDPRLIEAVHQVETGKSGSTCKANPSGATGPMQFLPSTFRHYANEGDDICDLRASVFAGAKLLANGGADTGNIDAALYNYNHSSSYVALVKSIMYGI